MVLTRPTKLVMCRHQICNLTHFICIPLVTASSRPLLQSSLGLLRNNPASASIPSRAFAPIDTLHLNLGVVMSLPTSGRFAEAERLLESLDLNSLTRELSKPSPRQRSIREKILDVERSLSLSSAAPTTQPLPLHLTLSSLVAAPLEGQDIMVSSLLAQCHDSTSRVRHLCNNPAIIFAAAGLFDLSTERRDRRIQLQTTGLSLPRVSLIGTKFMRSLGLVRSLRQPGKVQREMHQKFDCRELVRIFKDFVWADNIRLERLSICPLGLTNIIRQVGSDARLREACSVSLV